MYGYMSSDIHTYIHSYIYIHIYIHTYVRTYIRTYVRTIHINIYIVTYIHRDGFARWGRSDDEPHHVSILRSCGSVMIMFWFVF